MGARQNAQLVSRTSAQTRFPDSAFCRVRCLPETARDLLIASPVGVSMKLLAISKLAADIASQEALTLRMYG